MPRLQFTGITKEFRPLEAQIELRHLRYAVAAAHYGSFRRAAEALGVKQSTLSRCISQLEIRLGVVLFERTSGGVRLTTAGAEILRTSRHLVETVDHMAATAKEMGRGEAGRLTVGFYTSLSAGNLRASLIEYASRFPKVEIRTYEGARACLFAGVDAGRLDVAIVTGDPVPGEGKVMGLWSERIMVALPESHRLAANNIVYWTDLKDETFLFSQHDPGPEIQDILLAKLAAPTFANLGIKKVIIDSDTVKAHPKLLVSGVWCIADVEYERSEDKNVEPWILSSLKPIQLSKFDYDAFLGARAGFTTEEWIDLLFQTVGFDPEMFGRRSKLLQLMRLVPFVERNYNLIELGPKGTGKSHIFSEFSPHGILISGGEVTVPKLFVNNSSGKIGLVGYWDVVAFDEFAGRQKRVDKALVDIMKNYMANKSFSRGVETLGAEASMVFVGNTKHNVPYMLKHTDLFEELPEKYYDSAFIDRLHTYVPGWEIDVIRGEMFASGYGFVVDYLAEILRHMRNDDYSNRYHGLFTLSSDISTRDRDGVNKTFSGMMKLLFPADNATEAEVEEILHLAVEGRKRVKDQLLRIDSTYPETDFSFTAQNGRKVVVKTLEETEYPQYYHKRAMGHDGPMSEGASDVSGASTSNVAQRVGEAKTDAVGPREGHKVFSENQKGVTFADLFWPWLEGATNIVVTDPYIRMFHQVRNLMEFIEMIAVRKAPEDEVAVRLITCPDETYPEKQQANLMAVESASTAAGVKFSWEFDGTNTIHARHIVSDAGWKISLDRGLDIFQKFEMSDAFNLANRLQAYRQVKAFEVTYLRVKK